MDDLDIIDITLPENLPWRDRFERYREDVMVDPGHNERWRNYTPAKLDIDDQLGAFLTIERSTKRIIRFESVYRPHHWPENVARICNRTWVDPTCRASGLSRARNHRLARQTGRSYFHSYPYQIVCCRARKIDLAIISRENAPNKANSIKAIHHQVSRAYANWHLVDDVYFLVSPHRKTASCWQRIIWHALVPDAEQALAAIPTMAHEAFRYRFGETETTRA